MPVDIASGYLHFERQDVNLPGILALRWQRRYSSGAPRDESQGSMGSAWFHTYDATLTRHHGSFTFRTPTGASESFGDTTQVDKGGRAIDRGAFTEIFRDHGSYIVQTWDVDTGAVWRFRFAADRADVMALASVEDVTGNAIDLIRDGMGRLSAVRQRAEGRALILAYDSNDLIREITVRGSSGEIKSVARYEYDARSRLTTVFDAAGAAERYEYDQNGRVHRELARDGGVFSYHFDRDGRCVRIRGLDGYGGKRLQYYTSVRVTELTDSRGAQTRYSYLPGGQITEVAGPAGLVARNEYDRHGRITARIEANGARNEFAYDDAGNRVAMTDGIGNVHSYNYNDHHQPISVVDPAGAIWRREYDSSNRLTCTTDPLGGRWTLTYDSDGRVTEVVKPTGPRRLQRWQRGVLQSTTDFAGNVTRYEVDGWGRLVGRQDPAGGHTTLEYDPVDNVTGIVLPDGQALRALYDQSRNLISFTDANGSVSRFRYGPCQRLLERTDPLGHSVRYSWGTEPDDLAGIVNEAGASCTFERDIEGRITRERSFDGAVREFEYDLDGYTVGYVNGNGGKTIVYRDALHRITKEILSDGSVVEFGYDQHGSVSSAVNAAAAVRFERDPMGRVLRETQNDYWVESAYDSAGNLTDVRTSLNHHVHYTYDGNGNVAGSTSAGQTISFERNEFGQEIKRAMPGGVMLSQRFDAVGRMLEQVVDRPQSSGRWSAASDSPARRLIQRNYAFGPSGALVALTDSHRGRMSWDYDPLEHLTAVGREQGQDQQYSFDETGNILSVSSRGDAPMSQVFNYDPGNRLRTRGGSHHYEYDGEGRRIEMTVRDENRRSHVWTYQWNAEDRMTAVRTPSGEVWKYAYDAMGRRLSKAGPAGETRFLWRGDLLIQEVRAAEPAPLCWIYGNGSFTPVARVCGGQLHSVVSDHIGSPCEMVDAGGSVVWRLQYSSFGAGHDETARGASCPFRFQGQYCDVETGLHYNRFRYYDPGTASFTSGDPIGLRGGLNQYTAGRNPTGWIDPLGLTTEYPALAQVPYVRSPGDEMVAMSKPSTKDQLLQTHTYVNPGHHDPASPAYQANRSVLPENHVDLFRSSVPVETKSGKVVRWTREGTGRNAVYHRFDQHANGEFHWNGSTAGVTKGGTPRVIEDHLVPSCVKK